MNVELLQQFRINVINYCYYLNQRARECASAGENLAANIYIEVNEVYLAQLEDIDFMIEEASQEELIRLFNLDSIRN